MNYYDSYTYTYNSPLDSMLTGILAIYLIVFAVWFIFFVISYVFKGIGMYTIAKRQRKYYPEIQVHQESGNLAACNAIYLRGSKLYILYDIMGSGNWGILQSLCRYSL